MSLNRIDIMGRMTKDPELRRTNSGKAVTSFTLAVDRDFEKGKVDFIDCVAWGNTAEFVSKYFAKGRVAIVSGRLQLRDWTDNSGNKRRNAEVIADNVYFGDSNANRDSSAASGNTNPAFQEVEEEDDLPF